MNFKFSENFAYVLFGWSYSSLAIAKSSSDDSTSFQRRFNVEYTLCACRVVTYTWSFSRSWHSQAFNGVYGIAVLQILQISQGKRKIFCFLHQISSSDYFSEATVRTCSDVSAGVSFLIILQGLQLEQRGSSTDVLYLRRLLTIIWTKTTNQRQWFKMNESMNSKLHLKRKLERSISYAHKKIKLNTTILDKMFVKKYEKSSKIG